MKAQKPRLLLVLSTSGLVRKEAADQVVNTMADALRDVVRGGPEGQSYETTNDVRICEGTALALEEAASKFQPHAVIFNSRNDISLARDFKKSHLRVAVCVITGPLSEDEIIILPCELATTATLRKLTRL